MGFRFVLESVTLHVISWAEVWPEAGASSRYVHSWASPQLHPLFVRSKRKKDLFPALPFSALTPRGNGIPCLAHVRGASACSLASSLPLPCTTSPRGGSEVGFSGC